jgi:catalase (peroxidase I)
MRFEPEISDAANKGLSQARARLEPIKAKYPWLSYGDLWTLAAVIAIKAMGGPEIPWRAGRRDAQPGDPVPPNGRLPDATKDAAHIRDLFVKRMGFTEEGALCCLVHPVRIITPPFRDRRVGGRRTFVWKMSLNRLRFRWGMDG